MRLPNQIILAGEQLLGAPRALVRLRVSLGVLHDLLMSSPGAAGQMVCWRLAFAALMFVFSRDISAS